MTTEIKELVVDLQLGKDGLVWGYGDGGISHAIASNWHLEDAGLGEEPLFKVDCKGGGITISTYTTECTNDSSLSLFVIPKGTALKDVFTWYDQYFADCDMVDELCLYEDTAVDTFQDLVNGYSTFEELIESLDELRYTVYDGLLYHGTISANGKEYWVLTDGVQC